MAKPFDPYYTWLGIPPNEQPANHYRLLGLTLLETNADVISHAADQRMAHLKSLQGGKNAVASQRLLNELSAAAACLLQPDKKQAYDQTLLTRQPAAPPPVNQPAPTSAPIVAVVPEPAPLFSISTERHAASRRGPKVLVAAGACAALAVAVVGLSLWQLSQAPSQVAGAPVAAQGEVSIPPAPPSIAVQAPALSATPAVAAPMPAPAPPVATTATSAVLPKTTVPKPATTASAAPASPPPLQAVPRPRPAESDAIAVSTPAASPAPQASVPPENEPRSLANLLNQAGDSGINLDNPSENENTIVAVDLPPPDALERARAQIVELLGEEAKQAIKPEQKTLLARKMLGLARETVGDDASRYVLEDSARKLFIGAEDVRLAVLTTRKMSRQFKLDADALYTATFTALSDTTLPPDGRAELATAIMERLEVALAEHKFSLANDYSLLATKAASRAKDVELRKAVSERRNHVQRLSAQVKAFEEAWTSLAANPSDPAANLVIGKFKCFVLGDWNPGVAHMLKSGDSDYVAAAEADVQATKGEKEAALPAADAWCALAESVKKEDKDASAAALERAKNYYQQALAWSTGLDKVRIEKQLAKTELADDAPRNRSASIPRASQEFSGLVGRVLLDKRDAGMLVTYPIGYEIPEQETRSLMATLGVSPDRQIRVEMAGVLTLSEAGNVTVRHVGGSANRGVHGLYVDGKKVSDVGDDRTKDTTFPLSLSKGDHLVRWVLTGGELGTAQLEFFPEPRPGAPVTLEVRATKNLMAAARAPGVKNEVHFGSPSSPAGSLTRAVSTSQPAYLRQARL